MCTIGLVCYSGHVIRQIDDSEEEEVNGASEGYGSGGISGDDQGENRSH